MEFRVIGARTYVQHPSTGELVPLPLEFTTVKHSTRMLMIKNAIHDVDVANRAVAQYIEEHKGQAQPLGNPVVYVVSTGEFSEGRCIEDVFVTMQCAENYVARKWPTYRSSLPKECRREGTVTFVAPWSAHFVRIEAWEIQK